MMTWISLGLGVVFTAASSFTLWILYSSIRERLALMQELAQAKLDAAQMLQDKNAAEARAKIAKHVLAEKVLQDREAFQREIANADAATLADALRRKLSKGPYSTPDAATAGGDGAIVEPVQTDRTADTDRLGPKAKR